jgi:hypothetical protein
MIAVYRKLRRAPRHHGFRPRSRSRGALQRLIAGSLTAALAIALTVGAAAGAATHVAGQGAGQSQEDNQPAIAELRVQVMPEFDDPRVLVIVQGRLDISQDGLPVELTLPVPRGAQINQMAIMNSTSGAIESQPFDAEPEPGNEQWTLVTYELSSAHFFYEYYYAPFLAGNPERHFVFDFPTPYAVDGLKIEVQQPLEATDFSLTPPATLARVDEAMGFTYHLYEIGALGAGETISIDIAYRKETAEPSITREELMGSQVQGGADGPAGIDAAPVSGGENEGLWVGLGVVGLFGAGAAIWTWTKKDSPSREHAKPHRVSPRRATPQPEVTGGESNNGVEHSTLYCTDCGARLRAQARFCHVCGSRVAGESI